MATSREFSSAEASDSDSISVTSTAASEAKSVYELEAILAETTDDDDYLYYLIKWEGYPLERSSSFVLVAFLE